MKFYPFDINDFRSATGHLTRMQRALYRELLDTYYDKEQPFTCSCELDFERLAHKMACRTIEEKMDLQLVFDEFFPVAADLAHHNERADIEIARYHAFIETSRIAGQKSGLSRRSRNEAKAKAAQNNEPTLNRPSTDLEPTPNRPRTKEKEKEKEKGIPGGIPTSSEKPRLSNLVCAGETPAPAEKLRRPSKKAPQDFEPTAQMVEKIVEELHVTAQHIERETKKFKDHTFGRAITDWVGAWRNWLRNSMSFGGSKNRTAARDEQNLDAAARFARGEG